MEMDGKEDETLKAGDGTMTASPMEGVQYRWQEPLRAVSSDHAPGPSASGLSFSDSSNDSNFGYVSLFGETLVSKVTSSTFDMQQPILDDPPLPTMLPPFRPTSPKDKADPMALDDVADGGFRYSADGPPPLPPKSGDIPARRNSGALLGNFVGGVMGHKSEFMDVITCPCCQCFDEPSFRSAHSTLIDPHQTTFARSSTVLAQHSRGTSLLSDSDQEDEQLQLDHDMKTGVLAEGVGYRISQVIVEGLLHKKGSGNDWLGSRGWKPRWTRLVVGRIEGYGDVPVPMLCVSWYPTSSNQSTVIVLDSTVVLAVDLPHKEHTPHRFEIQHASSSRTNASLPVTRTFTADSKKARDTWVLEISQALFSYEKEKAKVKRHHGIAPLSVHRPRSVRTSVTTPDVLMSRSFDEAWLGDRFTTRTVSPRPPSPTRIRGASTMSPPPLSPTFTSRKRCSPQTSHAAVVSPTGGTTPRFAPNLATRSTSA